MKFETQIKHEIVRHENGDAFKRHIETSEMTYIGQLPPRKTEGLIQYIDHETFRLRTKRL